MKRLPHKLAMLGVNAVPAVGWFAQEWSAGTTLVFYWFENVAGCLLVAGRIAVHQRWNPCCGHFEYQLRQGAGGTAGRSFLGRFLTTSLVLSAGHGLFLAVMLFVLTQNGQGTLADVNWRSAAAGCESVLAFLAVDFAADLAGLGRREFRWIERLADRNLGRVVVVHLTIVLGMFGVAITGATKAFFGIFIGLKTMAELASTLPQWDPDKPPGWLTRIMNRVPNAHPGETFESFWMKDKAAEFARLEANDTPWPRH